MVPVGLDEMEGAAERLLRRLGLEEERVADPVVVLAELGYQPSPFAPRGCRGALTEKRVWFRRYADPRKTDRVLRHELGHLLAFELGLPLPHDELGVIDPLGLMLQLPRSKVLTAVRRVGYDGEALALEYPELSPADVFIRVALATGVIAALSRGPRSRCEFINEPPAFPLEMRARSLLDSVHDTRRRTEAWGLVASPFREGDRLGAVVFLSDSP